MSEINASDSHTAITARLGEFPLRAEFSLEPLVRYWENELADDDCLLGSAARVILDRVRQVPELRAQTITMETVRAHQDLVDALMVAVFAPSFQEQSYAAAMLPFRLQTFFATEAFSQLLAGPDGYLKGRIDADASLLAQVRIIHAYSLIIERVYGLDAGIEFPWISIVKDPETGLERHFKRLLDVDVVGEAPVLTEETRRRLRALVLDPPALMKVLPPEKFVIRGFSVVQAIEVTEQEVLSSIERDLIEKESIVSTERFRALQDKMRALLRRPEVDLGLAAVEGERVLVLHFGSRFEHACIFADST